jgi:hypothetical protein
VWKFSGNHFQSSFLSLPKENFMAQTKEKRKRGDLAQFTDPHTIEEAAYYKWLNRGRQGGDPLEDWLEAELELQSNLYSDDDDVERSLAFSVPQITAKG